MLKEIKGELDGIWLEFASNNRFLHSSCRSRDTRLARGAVQLRDACIRYTESLMRHRANPDCIIDPAFCSLSQREKILA